MLFLQFFVIIGYLVVVVSNTALVFDSQLLDAQSTGKVLFGFLERGIEKTLAVRLFFGFGACLSARGTLGGENLCV